MSGLIGLAVIVRPLVDRLGLWHITQTCALLTRFPPCPSKISWHSRQPVRRPVTVVVGVTALDHHAAYGVAGDRFVGPTEV